MTPFFDVSSGEWLERDGDGFRVYSGRVWRWKNVRNPWPGSKMIPHPLAHRAGQPVREIRRGRNGNALLEFADGTRTIAPWRAAL